MLPGALWKEWDIIQGNCRVSGMLIEYTCIDCLHKYTEETGDTEERVCNDCINSKELSDMIVEINDIQPVRVYD